MLRITVLRKRRMNSPVAPSDTPVGVDLADTLFLWLSPLESKGIGRMQEQRRQRRGSLTSSPLMRAKSALRRTFSSGSQQEITNRRGNSVDLLIQANARSLCSRNSLTRESLSLSPLSLSLSLSIYLSLFIYLSLSLSIYLSFSLYLSLSSFSSRCSKRSTRRLLLVEIWWISTVRTKV